MKFNLLLGALGLLALSTSQAATITFNDPQPSPGDGVASSAGATDLSGNLDGADADQYNYTYVARNRYAFGQTFTTGSSAGGYDVISISLQNVSYPTFTNLFAGAQFRVRVTNPSQAGNAGFVLDEETATLTSAALASPNRFPNSTTLGGGSSDFITFTFDTPFHLNMDTVYGMDVIGITSNLYFEGNGTNNPNAYTGGTAYAGGFHNVDPSHFSNFQFTPLTGDRVFTVELNAVPEPTSAALGLIGGCGLLAGRLRRRRSI